MVLALPVYIWRAAQVMAQKAAAIEAAERAFLSGLPWTEGEIDRYQAVISGIECRFTELRQKRQGRALIQPALTPAHNAGGLAVRLGNDVTAQPNDHDEIS